jgi:hypothetical protein
MNENQVPWKPDYYSYLKILKTRLIPFNIKFLKKIKNIIPTTKNKLKKEKHN